MTPLTEAELAQLEAQIRGEERGLTVGALLDLLAQAKRAVVLEAARQLRDAAKFAFEMALENEELTYAARERLRQTVNAFDRAISGEGASK